MIKNREYYLKIINNRKKDFLSYDVDFSNTEYSENFLKFYTSFMIWNMGHARLENDYNIINNLNTSEKLIAQTLIERNFKNEIFIESFLFALYYFHTETERTTFINKKLLECQNESLFHSYIIILRCLKEQNSAIDLDFDGLVKSILDKINPEEIVNLLWSSKTILGENYIEICEYYKNYEDNQVQETIVEILN